MFEASEALQQAEGTKKIKSSSFHQYSWNFEEKKLGSAWLVDPIMSCTNNESPFRSTHDYITKHYSWIHFTFLAGHNNQMEEVVPVDLVPGRTQLVSKAVLIHGLIPMTKNPAALKTPIIREAETGVPEKLEAVPLGARVEGVQVDHVVNVLPVGAVAAGAVEASLVKMPSTTPVTGEMIFLKLMTGIMKNILAHWQTLRYLRHLETVAQARNRGHRPPDQISNNSPSSLSNLCQQQVCI
jgi:hypothetical protein